MSDCLPEEACSITVKCVIKVFVVCCIQGSEIRMYLNNVHFCS